VSDCFMIDTILRPNRTVIASEILLDESWRLTVSVWRFGDVSDHGFAFGTRRLFSVATPSLKFTVAGFDGFPESHARDKTAVSAPVEFPNKTRAFMSPL
jgi:hypothetical protein